MMKTWPAISLSASCGCKTADSFDQRRKLPMRNADLLRMALAALWQQKTRTVLTTLGVTLGACMLTFSLSIGQGVQDALNKQFRAHDDLRRIQVYGGRGMRDHDEAGVPPEAIDVKGEMSDEKRARIRAQLVRRWRDLNGRRAPIPLNRDTIQKLQQIDHVAKVEAGFFEPGRLFIGNRVGTPIIRPVPVANRGLRMQLVTGAIPPADSSRAILAHEFLLYQIGLRDDAAIDQAIGKPVRVELYTHRRSPRQQLLMLFDAQLPSLSTDELKLLEKAAKQIPGAVEKLDLTPAERATLHDLLARRGLFAPPPKELTLTEEFVLSGVIRDLTPEEEKEIPFYERLFRFGDVYLPQQAGEELAERLPRRREEGFDSLTVIADTEENVRPVVDEIKSMGLEFYSAVDFVEQVLREIRLIRFVTAFIAAVALFVSGL